MATYKAFSSFNDRYGWICAHIRHRREATEDEDIAQTDRIARISRRNPNLGIDRAYHIGAPDQCWGVEDD